MKKIFLAILVASLAAAGNASAAYTFTSSIDQSQTRVTVRYHYSGVPSRAMKVYSWLGDKQTGAWIDRSNLLITIPQSSGSVTKDFNVTYDYQALGLGQGKMYGYQLWDGTTDSANPLSVEGQFTVPVPYVPTNPVSPGSAVITLSATGQYQGSAAGVYQETFDISPASALSSSRTVTLNVYDSASQSVFRTTDVTLPAGTNTVSPSFDDLPPGNYSAAVYDGSTKLSTTVSFSIVDSANPINPPSPTQPAEPQIPNAPQLVGGVSIMFGSDYVITETKADIPVTVSVRVKRPVTLSVALSTVGTSLGDPKQVMNMTVEPGKPKTFALHFTDLSPGQTYYFSLRNDANGTYSDPVKFVTMGGGVTNGGSIGGYLDDPRNGVPPDLSSGADYNPDSQLVPKCGRTDGEGTKMCTFDDLMTLVKNVIGFGLRVVIPIIATVSLLFAGATIIILGKVPDKTSAQSEALRRAKQTAIRIAIGTFIILTAWTVVSTILIELGVKHQYILLDIFSRS